MITVWYLRREVDIILGNWGEAPRLDRAIVRELEPYRQEDLTTSGRNVSIAGRLPLDSYIPFYLQSTKAVCIEQVRTRSLGVLKLECSQAIWGHVGKVRDRDSQYSSKMLTRATCTRLFKRLPGSRKL